MYSANYGRTDHSTCSEGRPPQQLANAQCFLPSTLAVMSQRRAPETETAPHDEDDFSTGPLSLPNASLDLSPITSQSQPPRPGPQRTSGPAQARGHDCLEMQKQTWLMLSPPDPPSLLPSTVRTQPAVKDPGCFTARWAFRGCGRRPLVAPPEGSRVVGGREAAPGAWPWQVSVQRPARRGYAHFCGGALVDRRWVLSAAHCFPPAASDPPLSPSDVSSLRVVAGLQLQSSSGAQAQNRSVTHLVRHQAFSPEDYDSDVALLRLDAPVRWTARVQPVCLPEGPGDEGGLGPCFISGWGTTSYRGQMSDALQEAEVELIPHRTCNGPGWYAGRVSANMQCAGFEAGGVDTCQGDSGGPLQCYHETRGLFYLVGVTSFGEGCARPRRPGVYARASRYHSWIRRQQEALWARSAMPWLGPDLLLVLVGALLGAALWGM
ncbi:ACRO protein, partial [Atractosteus spatula]|nr:ACRO protein [Atractosteus spatula]